MSYRTVSPTYHACSLASLTRQCLTLNIRVAKLFSRYRNVADGLVDFTVHGMIDIPVCNSKVLLNR